MQSLLEIEAHLPRTTTTLMDAMLCRRETISNSERTTANAFGTAVSVADDKNKDYDSVSSEIKPGYLLEFHKMYMQYKIASLNLLWLLRVGITQRNVYPYDLRKMGKKYNALCSVRHQC